MPVQLILLDSRTIGVTRLSISFLLLCVLNLVTAIGEEVFLVHVPIIFLLRQCLSHTYNRSRAVL